MAERTETPRGRGLTVEHLTASLAQIETWCRAVREALDSIPDKDAVRFPETLAMGMDLQSGPVQPKQKAGVCPPPDPDGGDDHVLEAQVHPKQKAGVCPPPDPDGDDDHVLEAQVHPKQKAGVCPPPDPDGDDDRTH